eukprot:Sdes_comp11080_c0_seq1m2699
MGNEVSLSQPSNEENDCFWEGEKKMGENISSANILSDITRNPSKKIPSPRKSRENICLKITKKKESDVIFPSRETKRRKDSQHLIFTTGHQFSQVLQKGTVNSSLEISQHVEK